VPLPFPLCQMQFVGETFRPRGDYPIDEFLYSNPSFWCKYMPTCPPGYFFFPCIFFLAWVQDAVSLIRVGLFG